MASRTLKLVVEYDGTRFVGWARQSNGLSVQSVLEDALQVITRESVRAEASGRTDAGVHALGQVVSIHLNHSITAAKMRVSLNALLPDDVAVLSVEEVADGFHARKSAKSKHYRYTILSDRVRRPLLLRTAFHVPLPLDVAAMDRAAQALVGKHDFSAFTKLAKRKPSCVRTVLSASVCKHGPLVQVDVTGTGFLYNMVRIITGTLIDVGVGRKNEDCIAQILASKQRTCAGFTVPPYGLALVEVHYAGDLRV